MTLSEVLRSITKALEQAGIDHMLEKWIRELELWSEWRAALFAAKV